MDIIKWRRFGFMTLLITFIFVLLLKGIHLDSVTGGVIVSVVGAYLGLDLKAKINGINK